MRAKVFLRVLVGVVVAFGAAVGVAGPALAETAKDFHIWNGVTGRCLDSNAGGDVYTLSPCNNGNFEKWNKVFIGSTTKKQIRDKATGRCLDSNVNGEVYTTVCATDGSNDYQNWYERSRSPNQHMYYDVNTGRCLDGDSAGNVYTRFCDFEYNNATQLWGEGDIF